MKANFIKRAALALCFCVLHFAICFRAVAQNYSVLKSFSATAVDASGNYTNGDGVTPQADLIVSG